ncbi:zinc finger, c3HC4 type (RING finger) domain-containing protein [Ditylenchus destructor]|nr:zinc finger, c3HC4 type (RING finger) domain-containing protein [Ditylenchus destructor]
MVSDPALYPTLIGIRDFVITKETIRSMLGDSRIMTLSLSFSSRTRVPCFGLSSMSAKQLFWMLAESDARKVDQLEVVKMHDWCADDKDKWANRTCDATKHVHITFVYKKEKPSTIEIVFNHGDDVSVGYCYSMCPIEHDAHFIIFAPKKEFNSGKMSFTSSLGYFTEALLKRRKKSAINERRFDGPNPCTSCYSAAAEVAFLPCGHHVICTDCLKDFHDELCPVCNELLDDAVKTNILDRMKCLLCAEKKKCHRVDAMFWPCRCVLGCVPEAQTVLEFEFEGCKNCRNPMQKVIQLHFQ